VSHVWLLPSNSHERHVCLSVCPSVRLFVRYIPVFCTDFTFSETKMIVLPDIEDRTIVSSFIRSFCFQY